VANAWQRPYAYTISLILNNGSLLRELTSLLVILGNSIRNALSLRDILARQSPKQPYFAKFPCIFPVEQGNDT
jgi:hypothetical protein